MEEIKKFSNNMVGKMKADKERRSRTIVDRQSATIAKRGIYGNIDIVELCKERSCLWGDKYLDDILQSRSNPEQQNRFWPPTGTFITRRGPHSGVAKLAWRFNGKEWECADK
jgi:hypothetical protein